VGFAKLKHCLRLVVMLAFVAACEPQRAPVSGGIVPPTPTPTPVLETPLRYGLGASLVPFDFASEDIRKIALVDQLTTENAEGYDLLVSLAPQDGWEIAPTPLTLAFVINPTLPPLNNAAIREVVAQSPQASELVNNTMWQPIGTSRLSIADSRARLLENGFVDGIQLTLAYAIEPGIDALEPQFIAHSIEIQRLPVTSQLLPTLITNQQAHLLWVAYLGAEGQATWAQQVGVENIVPLAQVPLYYLAAPTIEVVGYTDSGLPLIARR
jgi:hypothetical protein